MSAALFDARSTSRVSWPKPAVALWLLVGIVLIAAVTPVATRPADAAAAFQIGPDLVIQKTGPTDPVLVGENMIYTLDVANAGVTDATNVVITDTLPSNVSFVGATFTNGAGTCVEAGGVVTCDVVSIPGAGAVAIDIEVTVDDLTGSQVVPLPAEPTQTFPGGTTTGPAFRTGAWAGNDADAGPVIDIDVSAASVDPGAALTFTPTGAMGTVSGYNDVYGLGDPTFDTSLQVLFLWDTVPEAGGDPAAPDAGTAILVFDFSEPVIDPVLHIDRLGGVGGVIANSSRLTLLDGLTLTELGGTSQFDTTPTTVQRTSGVTGTSNSPECADPAATACGTIQIIGEVTQVRFLMEATPGTVEGAGGDGIEFIWDIQPVSDLAVEKTTSDIITVAGDPFTWTVTATNDGPDTDVGVTVTDVLPAGVTLSGSSPSVGTFVGGTWTIGNLAPGATETLTLTMATPAGVAEAEFENAATIQGTYVDPDLSNNQAVAPVYTCPAGTFPNISGVSSDGVEESDISNNYNQACTEVTASVAVEKISTNGVDTFTYTATNLEEPVPALTTVTAGTGVETDRIVVTALNTTTVLTEAIPADWELLSATCVDRNAAITGNAGTFGTLAGAALTIPATFIDAGADILCTFTNELFPVIDLEKTAGAVTAGSFAAGTYTVTYTVTANNTGLGAGDYSLLDTPVAPPGMSVASTTLSSTDPNVTTSPTNGTSSASVSSEPIDASSSETWDVTVVYNITDPSMVLAGPASCTEATGSGGFENGMTGDTDTSNNTACVDIPAEPELSIDKPAPVLTDTDGSGDASVGDTLTYTITATNDGPSNLTNVMVTDDLITPTGGTTDCALVAPGDTCTLIGTYLIVAADLGTDILNTATADSTETGPVTDDEMTPVPSPLLSIDKPAPALNDADGSGDISEGDTLTYTITATNGGTATLTNVVVSDDLITPTGGTTPCATVAPAGTCTLVGTYVVTAADLGNNIVNTATADSDQTDPVTDDEVTPVPAPSLAIDKPPPVLTDADGSGDVSVGDTLTYTITSTNDGTANLSNVVVSDSLITPTGGTTPCATVAPAGTCTLIGTYVVTAGDIGTNILNTATADSDETAPVTDDETTPVPTPTLTIDKPAPVNADEDGSGDVSVGDTLTYTITSTNSGTATLTNVVVTDDLITPTGGTTPCATVAPAGTCTLVGTYVVTAGDVGANIVNTATADSDQTGPVTDDEITPVPTPALAIDKPAPVNADEDGSGDVSVGDTLTYTITSTNSGTATLTNVVVTDDLITPTGGTTPCATVAPAGTCTLVGTYVVTAGDVGTNIVNEATADSDQTGPVTDDEITPVPTPELSIDKPAPVNADEDGSGDVSVGDTLTYTVTSTNSGSAALTNVVVTDDLVTPTGGTTPCALVAPAGTCTLVGTYVVTAGDVGTNIVNTATADSDQTDPVTDDEITPVPTPELSIDKPAPVNADEDGSGDVSVGDTLTYTITSTNSGTAALTNVVVTDDLITPTGGTTPCALVTPAGTCTLVGTYVVTAGDVGTNIVNTATADSDQTDPATDDEITPVPTPTLAIDKPAPVNADEDGSGDISVGDTLTYTITSTNSGTAALTNVVVTDDLITPTGGTTPCALVAPAGTCTLVGTYVVTAGDVGTNIVNTATADSDQTGPVTDDEITPVPTPTLTIDKPAPVNADEDGSGDISVGDTLTYTITSTNSGTAALTNVVVTDDLITPTGGTTPCALVAPAGTCTLIGTYVVTAGDVGTDIVNEATADSDQTAPVTDDETTPVPTPTLIIDKPAPVNADEDGSGDISVGDTLTYTITSTNSGTAALTNVIVTDDLITPTGGTTPCALVAPSGICTLVGTYVVTAGDIVVGVIDNEATADSDQTPPVQDTESTPVVEPALAIDKPAPVNADEDGSGDVSVGDTLTYTITSTNNGTANLTNVTVVDDLITPTGGTTPCGLVAPAGTCTLVGTYVVTAADLGTNIVNTATADSDQTDAVTDDEVTPVPTPDLTIDKPAPVNSDEDGSGDVSVGDTLTYTITSTNSGSAALTNVTVTDDLITPTGGTTPCALVAPAGTCTLVGTYVVTAGDVGTNIVNTATADSDQTDPVTDGETTPVPTPELTIDKPAPLNADEDGSGDVSVGDTLTYTITSTNSGSATLTNVTVTDDLITPTGGTTPCASVAVGSTCTLVGTYVVTAGDVGTNIVNTATADSDQTDPVTDDEITPVPTPTLTIDKPAPVNADEDGSGDISVGDTLTYTITSTNSGTAALTNVVVTDDLITPTGGTTPCALVAPAGTCTLVGTYVVTAGDVGTNIVNTATADSDQTDPVTDDEITPVPSPTLAIDKPAPVNADEDGSGDVSVGDTLTYTITATNSGTAALTNVVVTDDLITPTGGTTPCALVAPAGTCTLVGTYVVTAGDVGTNIVNTATADSDQTDPVTDDEITPVPTPTLTIDKPAPVNADEDGSGDISVGDTLTYTITSTNSGTAALTNVVVTDDLITPTGGTTPCALVAPAGTCTLVGTYVVTAGDVGTNIVNTATADSDQTDPVTDDEITPVPSPTLTIDKPAPVNADEDGSGDISVGDTLTYTITSTNSGTAALTNVVVIDDLITPTGGTTPCALVAPAGTCTLVGTYVVTAGDVGTNIVNTATADSDQTDPVTDDEITPVPTPELSIDKPAPVNADEDGSGDVSVGDTLTYTITTTNSGSAALTNVVVTDDLITPTGGTTPCALVAAAGTCTLVGTYVVTAADVGTNIVNTATGDSDQTAPVTDDEITPVPTPTLTIDKPAPVNADEDGSGDVSVGDTLTYTITATNSGTATLTNVVVTDDLITPTGGTTPCATVAPSGTCTLVGTYVVTAADLGTDIVNTATADSDQTDPVTDDEITPVPSPSLTVDKPAPVNSDEDGSGDVSVGDTLTYTITATNGGSATLTNVVVSDDLITPTGGTTPCASVPAGGTCTLVGTYVVTAGDIGTSIVNTATADSDQTAPVTDDEITPVPSPNLTIDKPAPVNSDEDGSGDVSVGDTLTYTITSTNAGGATLTNVIVSDTLITPTGGTTPCGTVAPGGTCTLIGTYVVTAGDIGAGSIDNTATADSDQTNPVTDDEITPVPTPTLTIDKPAPANADEDGSGDVSVGDTLIYTVTATNSGTAALTNVTVIDDLITPTGGTTPCALVAPSGGTCTLIGTYVVTAGDVAIGSIVNNATADSDQTGPVTDDETTPIPNPDLGIDKPAPVNSDEDGSGDVSVGDTLTYTITATNNGAATLTNLVVSDSLITPTGGTTPCASVPAGGTCTLVGTYVVTAADIGTDIVNTATADSDQTTPVVDQEVTPVPTPTLTIDKPAPVNADEDGSGDVSVGDTLTYTITSTNSGTAALTNVVVIDDLITPTGGTTPCALVAPGDTCTLVGTYVVTAGDIGTDIVNTATADSDQTDPVSDDEITPVPTPTLTIDKPAPVNADEDGSGDVSEGDTLTYTITATNGGTATLTNVVVTDDLITPTGGTTPCASVPAGGTCTLVGTYVVTAADLGTDIVNTATADSDQTDPVVDIVTTPVPTPTLTIDKPAPVNADEDGSGDVSEGDTLTYTITATNGGTATLTNVVVTDDLITPTGGTTPCPVVAAGGTCTLIGTYVVTAGDIGTDIVNTATADSDQTDPVTDDETTPVPTPTLTIDKPAPVNADEDGSGDVSEGDTLIYTITATNGGTAALTNVVVTDDLITPTGGTTPCALVAPGDTCTLVGTYVVTAGDIGTDIVNTATADSDQTDPVTDDETTPVPTPTLTVDKPAPVNADEDGSGDVSEGDTLTYTITATNGGTATLTNVVVTDDLITPTGGTTPCASVPAGGTCTLIGTYVVTAADLGADIVNTATADSDQTDPVTDDETTPVPTPTLTVDKPAPVNADEDGSGDVSEGDTLTYTITATNEGTATLTNVVVSDDLITPTGGTTPCASVSAGDTCTLIGTYVVAAGDVAVGSIFNTATADSDQTDPVTDDETTPIPNPDLSVDKPAPVNADEDGSGDVSEGDTLTYTITATNDGGATLTNLVVSDDLITPTGGTTPCASVPAGGTCTLIGTYVVTAADVGTDIVNTATADSDQTAPVIDQQTTPVPTPTLTVDKPAPVNADEDGSGDVSEGDTLTYTITATNEGTATLTNLVVSDDLITPTGGTTPCASVSAGDTCTLIGTYVVAAGDVAVGSIFNTATADSDQTDPVTDDETTPIPNPDLSVDKPAPVNADEDGSGDVSVGDTLTYTITATNDGGATLTNLVVSDDLITPTGGTTPCASVPAGGTCTLIGTYVVTAADVGTDIVNTATADSDQTAPVIDQQTTPVPTPTLTVDKPAPVNADEDGSGDVSVGDTLTYTITATNSGTAALTNVIVSDSLITPTGGTTPCPVVAAGGTCTLIGTYEVTAADLGTDIVNTATADSDQTDPVTDDETTPVPTPTLTIDKPAPVNADEDGSGDVSEGDTLTYTITATNGGTATLTNVVVTDDLITPTGGTTPCASVPAGDTCTLVGTYIVTGGDVAAGSIVNTATADSDQTDPVTDDETTPLPNPDLGVDKPAPVNADEDGSGDVSVGDTLTYTITATNNGASTLTNLVVSDSLITPTGGTTPCASVAPGGTCTLVGTYVVTAADVGTDIVNTATADSDQTGPVIDQQVTPVPTPGLTIDKPAPINTDEDGSGDVSVGDTLTYTITATNGGTSTLTNVIVSDSLITPTGGTTPCPVVAPGGTCTLVGTYVVTAADLGIDIFNIATADSDQTDPVTDDEITPVPTPGLTVDKPAPVNGDEDGSGDVSEGDTLTYTITATNGGTSTLTNVIVTDSLITPTGGTTPCAAVPAGGTCTLVGAYVVTAGDVAAGEIVNTATADSDQTGPVTDDEITPILNPDLGVDKPAPINADEDGSGDVSEGDTLTYTITATNNGASTLTNLVVSDDLITATGGTTPCAAVAPGGTCTLVGTYVVVASDAGDDIVNTATADSDQTGPVTDDEITPVLEPDLSVDKPAPTNADEDGSGDVSEGDTLTYTITATNAGPTNLTNVVVSDNLISPTGGSTPCAFVAPGDSCTLVGTYVVTAGDVAAGSIVNTATADSDQTPPTTDDEVTPIANPDLSVDKPAPVNADEDGSGDVSEGDTLTYTITATNNGGSNLTNVVVSDDLITPTGGSTPCANVAPSGTCTLVGTYVVTAGDVAAGSIVNTATADSDQTPPTTDDEVTPIANPDLSVDKPAPVNADEDGSGDVSEGDTLTYTITATNNGGSNLTNVVVSDDLITPTGGSTPCANVAPAGTCTLVGTYVVTAGDVAAGSIVNTATADSDQTPPVTDDQTTPVPNPDLSIIKPAPTNADEDGTGDISEGDTLTYTITATNNGSSTLTNLVVTDDLITATGGSTPCASVAAGGTCTLIGTYVVTAGDVAAGSILNTATADSDQTPSAVANQITPLPNPGLDVDKPAPTNIDEDGSGDVSAGDTLTYTITATNTGDAVLTDVIVSDDLITPTGGTTPCASVGPIGTCTLVGTYVVTEDDVAAGSIVNTATADSAETPPTNDSVTVGVAQPGLDIDKPAPTNIDEDGSGDVSAGDTLTYTITATNTGGAVLTNLVVADPLVTATGGTTPCASVPPGGTCTLIGTYTATPADVASGSILNTATADSDQTGPATDDEITPVAEPAVDIDKPAPALTDTDGNGQVSEGDTLTYTITLTNSGAAGLTNVTVSDDLITPTGGSTPCALLASGETCTLVGTYLVTADDVAAGSIVNTATGNSDQTPPVTDDETTPVPSPQLVVDKPAPVNADEDGSGDVSVGDTLTYTITATNTGAATLTNVAVTDSLITATAGTAPCASVAPGADCTLIGTYIVTAADVVAGQIVNTASADSDQTPPATADETTPVPNPQLTLEKGPPINADEDGSGDVSVGDTLTYTIISATNTGDATLTNVVLTDDLITPTGGSSPCAVVPPGGSCDLIGTYVVTPADVIAGAITNTAGVDSDQTDPTTADEITPVPQPELAIDKPAPVNDDADGNGSVTAGDTLTYTITATNTGTSALTNVEITDSLITVTGGTAPCALVGPGETCTLIGTYVVDAADVAAESILNTASADSDQTDPVTDDETVSLLPTALEVEKSQPVNSDEDGSGDFSAGDTLTYTITATNVGLVNLTDVTVVDSLLTVTGGTAPCAVVAPGETCTLVGTYVLSDADLAFDSLTNVATADSTQTDPVTASVVIPLPTPDLLISKPAPTNADEDGSGDVSAGDTLTYTITATNGGGANLTNVTLTDSLITVTGGTAPCALVAPTETCTLVGTYAVTPADVAAGEVTNTAGASSDQTGDVVDDITLPILAPTLGIVKPAPVNADEDGSGDVSVGDTLTYSITATNAGGATLTNVIVTDSLITPTGGTTPCATLATGETCTLEGTYVVTADDVVTGSIVNTASAGSDQTPEITADVLTPVPSIGIEIVKPEPVNADEDGSSDVSVGDTLTYTITATNTGGANLTNVVVADDLITPTGGSTPCALLASGETCTLEGTYVVGDADVAAGEIVNVATVTSGQTVPASDSVTVPIAGPGLEVVKPAPANTDEDGSGDISEGDTLTYIITANNTGDAVLTNVEIIDPLITQTAGSNPCASVIPGGACTLVGTYVVTAGDVVAGSINNEAIADSDQTPPAIDSVTVPVAAPVLSLEKPTPTNIDEDSSGDVSVGDTLTYTITATNTGGGALTNVIITDALLTPTGGSTPCALMLAGGTCTLVGTYVVTEADVAAGGIVNIASADSDQTPPTTATVTVEILAPSLAIDKPAPVNADDDGSGDLSIGDTLTYTVTATNDGGSVLTNVIVTDLLLTPTGGSTPCAVLLPGETCTLTGTYIVQAADAAAGLVLNTASASSDQTPTISDEVAVSIGGVPELAIDKPAPVNADEDGDGAISIGDTLTYTITATNTGTANLTEVVVTDDLIVRTGGTSPCTLIAPGETCTLIGTYVVTSIDENARQFTNVAVADSAQTVSVQDEITVPVIGVTSPPPQPPGSPQLPYPGPFTLPTPVPVVTPPPSNPLAITGSGSLPFLAGALALMTVGGAITLSQRRRRAEEDL